MRRIIVIAVLSIHALLSLSEVAASSLDNSFDMELDLNTRDSILTVLKNSESQHSRFLTLVKMHKDKLVPVDESYALVLEEYIEYGEQYNCHLEAFPLVNSLISYYIYDAVALNSAATLIGDYKPYVSLLNDIDLARTFYLLSAESMMFSSHYEKAIESVNKGLALTVIDSLNFEIAYLYLKAGEAHYKLFNAVESINAANMAAKLFHIQKDTLYQLWSKNCLASMYDVIGLYDDADKERTEIIAMGPNKEYNQVYSIVRLSSSMMERKKGNMKKELEHLRYAIGHAESSEVIPDIVRILSYSYTSSAFSRADQLDSAKYYLDILDDRMKGKEHNTLLNIYYQFSKAYYALAIGKYETAEGVALQNRASILLTGNQRQIMEIENLLHEIYRREGNYESSLQHFTRYATLRDSIMLSENARKVIYLQSQFNTEKKDLEIARQKSHIESIKSLHKSRKTIGLALMTAIISFITGLYLYRSRKFVEKTMTLKSEFTHDLINFQEKEKQRLSQELHDSIAQDLIYLTNRAVKADDQETASFVKNTLQELRTISQGLHPFVLEKFGLSEGLRYWINYIDERYDVFFDTTIEEVEGIFTKDQELHIYRIVQEAINNAVKYSKSPTVKIELLVQEKNVLVRIQDYGVGFNKNNRSNEHLTLGMSILNERSQMIPASLDIKSESNKGTIISLIYEL